MQGNARSNFKVDIIERQTHTVLVLLISLIVIVVLWPVTMNQLTSWDDKGYVTANTLIRDLSWAGIKAIFSTPVMGNYHPLPILTYALEYHFVELNPFLYHLDNLLIHIGATALSYILAWRLTEKKLVSILVALLFGLHPMHVETVAWVADRKDSLCAVFTFCACVLHVSYIKSGQKKWYWLVILAFIAALLSKPVAVVVPLSMLLIDYALLREWNARLVLEKVPHFCLALLTGIAAFYIQQGGGAMQIHKQYYAVWERAALGLYALLTYLWKSALPIGLKAIYPYPPRVGGSLPWYCFAAPMVIVALVYFIWRFGRRNRLMVFGLLFFFVNIVLLLQFVPVGDSIVSERYAYIPYFGLFLVFADVLAVLVNKWRAPALSGICFLFIALFVTARARCYVWYDTKTLWADEIQKEPARVPIAYNNIGFYYFERQPKEPGDIDSAVYYLQAAAELKPDMANALEGLGIIYYMNKQMEASEINFRRLTEVRPDAESFYDLGAVWFERGKKDSAIIAYSKALTLNPAHVGARINRAASLQEVGRWAEACSDIDIAIKNVPGNAAAYYYRSFCDTQSHQYDRALQDVEAAIARGYHNVDTNYYRRLKIQ